MKQSARWGLVIALLQVTVIGVYWLVEKERRPKTSSTLGTDPPQHVNLPMPSLTVVQRDGSRIELTPPARRTILHIWATWCQPCREELPGLLALASRQDVAVVAVALDSRWDDVGRFLGDLDASAVVLADSKKAERAFGVRILPVTFLVEAGGRITRRFDGARNWTDEAFVRSQLSDDPL